MTGGGTGRTGVARTRDQRARRSGLPNWLRWPGYFLATVLGLAGIIFALVQLITPRLPLRVEHSRLDGIPITVFSNAGEPGPAIVIAHGFAGSQQIMFPFAVTLARNGYTAVTLDFPGHGQNVTPLQGDITDAERRYAQLVATLDQVVTFARARSDGRVGLLGHSMGSEAVARYAQAYPGVEAVVAVSMVYDGVTPTSPPNLLLLTGALEAGLRPLALEIAGQVATGAPQTGVTYGDFAAGTARRVVFVPAIEHIGVLFSTVSMAEALAWFNQSFARIAAATPYLDNRAPWIGLLFLSAMVLFWPFTLLLQPVARQVDTPPHAVPVRWQWWAVLALVPALVTPLLLRLLPTEGLLPILVGGPLALHFALYGLLTGLGLGLRRLIANRRPPAARADDNPPRPPTADRQSPADQPRRASARRHPAVPIAMALLVAGYVFLTFGVPTHLFVLNYFPPVERLSIAAMVFAAMLPYFLADEWLTRGPGAPRVGYVITKGCFILSLVLALALNPRLFFLVIIAPLFIAYFLIYGLFSGRTYRRTGTPLVGALANAVICAWIVAAVFPLVG